MFKTVLARHNWRSKYQYGTEAPLETFERVCRALASVEKPEKQEYWFNRFLRTMVKFDKHQQPIGLKCTTGGRITANAGTHFKGATLMNCFINGPVKNAHVAYERAIPGTDLIINNSFQTEDNSDNLSNIFLTMLEQAETLKSEGGWGMNFDWIRPRNMTIQGLGIPHPGVVAYMELFDKVSEIIVRGNNDGYVDLLRNYLGDEVADDRAARKEIKQVVKKVLKKMVRKGAMMGCLTVDHPDIEEFVRSKQIPGKLTKFNISVVVTDEFMEAVEADSLFELKFKGVVHKIVRARDLYTLIMESTYNRAEPGIIYHGNMQRNNPLSYMGEVNATNPCGEIPGNPVISTVCLLGSINLAMYVNDDRTFDWAAYKEDVDVFARMLDNVNDITEASLPQYKWAIKNIRQYGMGVNAVGSALFMMGIPYNSPEGVEFVEKVCWLKEEICWRRSALLAEEKGPFPAYNEKFLETHWFTQYTTITEETKDLIRKHGVRNAKTTTNPPLGNSSVLCDNVSNGIEPVFSMEYQRTYVVDQWPEGMTRENVASLLPESRAGDAVVWKGLYQGTLYYYEPHNRGLCAIEVIRDYGYQWVLDNYPQDLGSLAPSLGGDAAQPIGFECATAAEKPFYLVTTDELSVEDHVAVQTVVQRHCNQSVSKTANIPNDYPFEQFQQLYIKAWKAGLNGFTTYRAGSMEAVLTKIEAKEENNEIAVVKNGLELPDEFINGPTKVFRREGHKFYTHFSYLPEDSDLRHPIAIWLTCNDVKGELAASKAAVRNLVSLLRRFEIEEPLIERQLEKIKGNPSHQQLARMVSMCLRHKLPIPQIVLSLEDLWAEGDYISSTITAVRKFLGGTIEDGTKISGKKCGSCESTNLAFESGCSKCLDCGAAACG